MLPLWIWLGVAVPISFLFTPVDPLSMLAALAYGLVTFWIGAILGSSFPLVARIVPTVIWSIPAVALALLNVPSYVTWIGFVYLIASIALGYWASQRITTGKLRIITAFSTGFLIGSLGGAIGTVAGATCGALLARKAAATSDPA